MKKDIFIIVLCGFIVGLLLVPVTRRLFNEYIFTVKQVDENTNYTNRKQVEDTARSTIVNYNMYRTEYETYKEFCNIVEEKNKCQRALDSKLLANKSVQQYNEFIQKNRFIFKDNLPSDIPYSLEKIE